MRKSFFALVLLFCTVELIADTYTDESACTVVTRIPVWVFLETMPGFTEEHAAASMPPRKAITELSAKLLSGLVYGWKFSYTPSDKTRNVAEYFELEPIYSIQASDPLLSITELTPHYPYLYCYAEYRASSTLAKRQQAWASVSYKSVQGSGSGQRSDELDGIYDAYINAAKNAVRQYARSLTKNKPKAVNGELLLKGNPRLFMKSGTFHATVNADIYITEIIPYTMF